MKPAPTARSPTSLGIIPSSALPRLCQARHKAGSNPHPQDVDRSGGDNSHNYPDGLTSIDPTHRGPFVVQANNLNDKEEVKVKSGEYYKGSFFGFLSGTICVTPMKMASFRKP
jgi:hypothetical protein